MPSLRGKIDGSQIKVALVVSRFNERVTAKLLTGAEERLERDGCSSDRRTVVHVPGAWEIPQAAKRLADSRRFDAVIGLGALIRGETPHFDVLAAEAARGLMQVGMDSGVPTIFGVLTTDTMEQAVERSGGKSGNKGWEAAAAAMEMADLFRRIDP